MFQAQARWLLLTGLSGSLLFACSDDAPSDTNTTAGAPSTSGSSGAAAQGGSSSGSGGSSSGSGGSSTAGTMSSSGTGGGGTSAGAGGSTAGSGGSVAGSGGATAGSGGACGGGGSGGGAPTAVANITGLGANAGKVTGTATFTQGATMTKLVLTLTACPDGVHASHLHEVNDCGNNGDAALNHWVPNGEDLGNYTCANGMGMLEEEKPIAMWTVGDGSDADVTKHSFMVHAAGDPNAGGRIGCGVVMKK